MASLGIHGSTNQFAGFCDQKIVQWQIQEQAKVYPCSISLKDMFTGGFSETARTESSLRQQVNSWIRGKVTACIQVADTDVIRQIKLIKMRTDNILRAELAKLAELENTRAIFACGMYEMMRTLQSLMKIRTRSEICIVQQLLVVWLVFWTQEGKPQRSKGRNGLTEPNQIGSLL